MDQESLRADLLREKDFAFRDTDTYRLISRTFAQRAGKPAPYAMLPQIRLKSPKIRSHMTTEIFARAVMRRYERCMAVR
jgi:hypothetical protein